MTPFNVIYQDVPDERISELLSATNAAGFATPSMTAAGLDSRISQPAGATPTPESGSPLDGDADLPDAWRVVRELEGQSYRWPEEHEHYTDYRIYAGETRREGTVHIALGESPLRHNWDRDRMHVVAFLSSGSPQKPLAEYSGTDDFAQTRELIAVIRGRGEAKSKKMFGPGDPLPKVYEERFRTGLYSDHIRVPGAWSKLAVLARADEPEAMLNHALLQARRRGDI